VLGDFEAECLSEAHASPSISHTAAGADMNRFRACLMLSVAFLDSFLVTGTGAQSGPEDAVSGLMAAWNLKDAHAFASQFTEDATFVNVNGTLWIGKKDIEDRHANARIFKSSHAELKPDSIRLLTPDIALVHVSWTITGDPRDPQPRGYLMTMVVSKREGRWLIVAAQNGSAVDRSTLPGTAVLLPSPLPTAPDADQVPSDVRRLLAEADKVWNQHDAKAVASLFADHADLVDTSARRFSGRDNIEKHIADVLSHQFHGTRSRATILTSTVLGPDLAVLEVQWELLGEGRNDKTLTITGLRVLTRNKARWWVCAVQDTVTRPLPAGLPR
jgi:uncharacterized protein (TIGR02246 family)